MYYYISGELVHTEANTAVVDAGGIGYRLTVSNVTLGRLANVNGTDGKVKLFTYLSVREDALELFGFFSTEELSSFKMLISVSGVGPKAAMSILSLMTPERFALTVTAGDAKALSKAPGIGAKTAARIILELKDKLSKQLSPAEAAITYAEGDVMPYAGGNIGEAQNALLVLGYSRAEAVSATAGIDGSQELEAIIRLALKKLAKS